nr:AAA family ATPase [Streptomyces sp. L2]
MDRRNQIQLLESAVGEAVDGAARIVLIEGAVGCGKTELLESAAEMAVRAKALVLRAEGARAERNIPFGVVAQLAAAAPEGALDAVPDLATAGAGGSAQAGGSAAAEGIAARQVFVTAVQRLAADTPLAICVDDLHLVDEPSRRYLLHLAGRLRRARVLLVFAESLHERADDPELGTDLLRRPGFARIELAPLTRDGVAAVLERSGAGPRGAAEAHALTGGNPLLLRALTEDGGPGRAFVQAFLACLRRSGSRTEDVAGAVAVLGSLAAPGTVAGLLGLPEGEVKDCLDALTRAGLLDGTAFRHPALRTALLDHLDSAVRPQRHQRAAELAHAQGHPATDVAMQLLAAGEPAPAWAGPVLRAAADRLLADGEHRKALECLQVALEGTEDPAESAELRTALAAAQLAIDPAAADQQLAEPLAALRAGRLPSPVAARLARLLVTQGRIDEAGEVLRALTPHQPASTTAQPPPGAAPHRPSVPRTAPAEYPGHTTDRPPARTAADPGTPGARLPGPSPETRGEPGARDAGPSLGAPSARDVGRSLGEPGTRSAGRSLGEPSTRDAGRADEHPDAPGGIPSARPAESGSAPSLRSAESGSAPSLRSAESGSAPSLRSAESGSAPSLRSAESGSAPSHRSAESGSAPSLRSAESWGASTTAPSHRSTEGAGEPGAQASGRLAEAPGAGDLAARLPGRSAENPGTPGTGAYGRSAGGRGVSDAGLSGRAADDRGSAGAGSYGRSAEGRGVSDAGLSARTADNRGDLGAGSYGRSAEGRGTSVAGLSGRSVENPGAPGAGSYGPSVEGRGVSDAGVSGGTADNRGGLGTGSYGRSAEGRGVSDAGLSGRSVDNPGAPGTAPYRRSVDSRGVARASVGGRYAESPGAVGGRGFRRSGEGAVAPQQRGVVPDGHAAFPGAPGADAVAGEPGVWDELRGVPLLDGLSAFPHWAARPAPPAVSARPKERALSAAPAHRAPATPHGPGWAVAFWGVPEWERSARGTEIAEALLRRTSPAETTLAPVLQALRALLHLDGPRRALPWTQTYLDEAARRGAPGWQAVFALTRAEALLRQGDLPGAEQLALEARSLVPEHDDSLFHSWTGATLAAARTPMGRHDDAGREVCRPQPEGLAGTFQLLAHLKARGTYYFATNRYQAALADYLDIGRAMRRWGIDRPVVLPWRTLAADALLQLGEVRQAARLVADQLASRDIAHPWVNGLTVRLKAALAEPAERPALLTHAVDELRRSGDRLELARAMADLGEAFKESGDPGRATMVNRRAWQLAKECGAQTLRERILPGRAAVDAPDAARNAELDAKLSESEKRVALLAVHGHTNREIALKLYITVSTVEQHLTRVYRKLNITRRQDLPADLPFSEALDLA